jgi:integrase
MASKGLYKRGNVWWIRYAGVDGRIRRETTQTTNHREAQALLIKRKQAILEGNEPEVKLIKNYLFKELAVEYEKWAERQRSYNSKKYFIAKLVKLFGNIPLRQFNTMLIEQYQTNDLNSGYKPATVNRHLATLKHMFTKASDWEMVDDSVLAKIRKVKLLEESNKRLRFLSREECQALVDSAKDFLKPIIVTALNTGMRKAEILNLKWDQVDLKHGFILLDITKNGERREIPINETLEATFKSLPRRLDIPYVFYNPETDKPYRDIKGSFNSACRKAKITDYTFHDNRHTFASHLIMGGIDLTTVRDLLGHSDIKMTLRYSHLAPSHKKTAVNVLDSIINLKPTAQLLHNLPLSGIKKAVSFDGNKAKCLNLHGGAERDRTVGLLTARLITALVNEIR